MEHSPYLNKDRTLEVLQDLLRQHERQQASERRRQKSNPLIRRPTYEARGQHLLAKVA